MSTAIYNPDCVDSILTAAFLQTLGWETYSNSELLPNKNGAHAWLNVLPSRNHFHKGAVNPNTRHVFYSYGHKTEYVGRTLLPKTEYANTIIQKAIADNQEKSEIDQSPLTQKAHLFNQGGGQLVLLDQVCAVEEINTPEQMMLSWLIQNYYKSKNQDVVAITTLNIYRALQALHSREGFTPVRLPIKGKLDDDLIEAHALYSNLRIQTERIFANSASSVHIGTQNGKRRLYVTYAKENWWFHRRALASTDIGYNINLSITGTHISVTDFVVADVEKQLNVQSPSIIIV